MSYPRVRSAKFRTTLAASGLLVVLHSVLTSLGAAPFSWIAPLTCSVCMFQTLPLMSAATVNASSARYPAVGRLLLARLLPSCPPHTVTRYVPGYRVAVNPNPASLHSTYAYTS